MAYLKRWVFRRRLKVSKVGERPRDASSVSFNSTGWGKIKCPNMKIAISQKCVNVFAPHVVCLFVSHTDLRKFCCFTLYLLMYAKLTETQLSRTNFATEKKEWLSKYCSYFTDKDSWPPNSPDLNPLDYYVWGVMLEKFRELKPKPQNVTNLKRRSRLWNNLPNETIHKSVLSFCKPLLTCIKAEGGHTKIRLTYLVPIIVL